MLNSLIHNVYNGVREKRKDLVLIGLSGAAMVKRILFVCSGNIHRSPTAAKMFEDSKGFEVRSAGTSLGVLNPVDAELIRWADKIFVMEEKHREIIVRQYPEASSKITVLGIEDNYYRDDPQLKAILKEMLESYFNSQQ